MEDTNKKEAVAEISVKTVKPAAQKVPVKTHPTMREAIIWSEIISPPLSKRKRSKPYTTAR
jgi:hypothetical protein